MRKRAFAPRLRLALAALLALLACGLGGAASAGDAAPVIRYFVKGNPPAGLVQVAGAAETKEEAEADVVWDAAAGTVDHRMVGRVAEGVDAAGIGAVLAKWVTLGFLTEDGTETVNVAIASGAQVYKRGDIFEVTMDGANYPYLTMFNLPPDGRVELFVPSYPTEPPQNWRGQKFSEKLRVSDPPFGAEHIVAILTPQPATALQAALRKMDTAATAGGLSAAVLSALSGKTFQAGVVPLYTAPK